VVFAGDQAESIGPVLAGISHRTGANVPSVEKSLVRRLSFVRLVKTFRKDIGKVFASDE
jgi:hypothetical protein